MPTQFLINLADSKNVSLSKVEKIWNKAKEIAKEKYETSSEKYWPYVMGLTKRMVKKSQHTSYLIKYK